MAEHPAAPLLAQDLGRLPHTNKRGELGVVHIPGFVSTAGMNQDQADEAGLLALAIAEGVIEDLGKHGYKVIHKSEIKAQVDAAVAAQGGPAEPSISKCKRCRLDLLRPGPTIDVPTMIRALQAHAEVCQA